MTAEEEFAAAEAEAEFSAAEQASEADAPSHGAVSPSAGLPVDNLVTARTVEQQPLYAVPDSFSMADEKQVVRQQENGLLRFAFEQAQKFPNDAAALEIAKKFGVRAEYVRANLPAWQQAAASVDFDPEDIDPALRKAMLRDPELAPTVLSSKTLNPLFKAAGRAFDWIQLHNKPDEFHPREAMGGPVEALPGLAGSGFTPARSAERDAYNALQIQTPEQFDAAKAALPAQVAAQQAEREKPRLVQEVEDNKAALLREGAGPVNATVVAIARAKEAQAQLDLSKLWFRSMAESLKGNDTTDLDSRIHDAELAARPRAYGEDSTGQIFTDAINGAVSSIDVLGSALKTGGVLAGLGAVGGAAVGGYTTKTPAGAIEGAVAGASKGAELGGTYGAAERTFVLEAGSSYKLLLELETDGGRKLTRNEAAGGAILAGLAKTGLEMMSLKALVKTAGPAAQLLRGKGLNEVSALMAKNAGFRKLAAEVATAYAEEVGTEFATEAMQEVVDQVAPYVAASAKDAKLQRGPIIKPTEALEAGYQGGVGALFLGAGGASFHIATSTLGTAKAVRDPAKVDAITALADDEATKAAPAVVAEAVREAGGPESMHVDAAAVVRFFQQKGEDGQAANAEVERLLGPEGPQKLMEAAAVGGKVEVPMATYLGAWAASEVGKATKADTSTDAATLSHTELRAQAAEIEAEAQAIAAQEAKKVEDETAADEMAATLYEELRAAGRSTKEARSAQTVWKHFWRTQGADFGVAPAELFKDVRVHFGLGEGSKGSLNQPAADDAETRARGLFFDPLTGLRNARGWEVSPRTPGRQVAVITSTDVKPINDEPTGGHDTTNTLLQQFGEAIGKVDPEAARDGTKFFVHVENQAALDSLLNTLRAKLPAGLTVDGLIGETRQAAAAALDANFDAERNAGTRAARGKTKFDLSQLRDDLFAGKKVATSTTEAMRQQAATLSREQYEATVFQDSAVPRVLSKAGFDRAPAKRFTASFDGIGLGRINKLTKSDALGNDWLKAIMRRAVLMGGEAFYFAHLSGDEFAAKADSQEELQSFIDDLKAELQDVRLPVTLDGRATSISPQLRFGIAEGGYGLADRDLNRRKRLESPARDDDGAAGRLPGEEPAGEPRSTGGEVSRRVGAEERRARADVRRVGAESRSNRQDAGRETNRLKQSAVEPAAIWFSQVEKAASAAKQEKNSPAAWWALISKSPGVKAEELEFLGLKRWLDEQKKSLTRDEVVGFINAHRIEVTETEKGGRGATDKAIAAQTAAAKEARSLKGKIAAEFQEQGPAAANIQRLKKDFDNALKAFDSTQNTPGSTLAEVTAANKVFIEARDRLEAASTPGADVALFELMVEEAAKAFDISNLTTAIGMVERARQAEARLRNGDAPTTIAKLVRLASDTETAREKQRTQFAAYTLTGKKATGSKPTGYRELLFHLPGLTYQAPHFGNEGQGLLAHARTSDARTADDRRILLVEEIQSDLHQAGRDVGYASTRESLDELIARERAAEEALLNSAEANAPSTEAGPLSTAYLAAARAVDAARRASATGVPNAPLKTTWDEMVAKRLLRMAADEGFESIGWTTGEQQADRYNLAKHVDRIAWNHKPGAETGKLWGTMAGRIVLTPQDVKPADLDAYVGTTTAKRLLEATPNNVGLRELTGEDLRLGGQGMRTAYDQRIPSIFKKLLKKDGGTVQQEKLATGETVWTATLPKALLERVRAEGQPLFQDERGSIEWVEGAATERALQVFLRPNADVSTVLHESAHAFLEMLGALAARTDAPQRVRETYAMALEALGAEPGKKLTVDQHERFAKGFEAWLYEGKAPSKGLEGAFQRFKAWLLNVYRTVASIDVELTDDLREVFARMLATDDEIQRQLRQRSPATEATTPEQQADDLLEAHELTRKAELYALKDRLRTHEKWWRDGLAKLRTTFGEEYERLPARVAQRILQGEADDVVLASEPLVLDKAFVEAVLGERRAPGIRTAVDGIDPDEVAQLAGFKTGADMLRSVVDLPQRDTWVEKQAEEAMKEAHPSVLEERKRLRELVADGLQGFSEKKILREWAELTAKAGGSPAPVEALKRAAAIMVERRKVGDLKPARALQAERAAATAKARAAAKGDWTAALEAGRQQLLNAYLYAALRDAKKEREALEGLAGELRSNKARARLGKAMPVYRDAVDFVVGLVGLSEPTELKSEVLDQAVAQMNGDAVIVGDPEWLEPLKAVSGDLKTLTVAQMRVVGDALKQLRAAARHRTDVLLDDKAADKEETIAALVAEAEAALPKRKAPGTASANTVLEQLGGLYNLADGTLMSPTEMVRDLAGDDPGSTWWRALVLPFRRAKHREADLLKAAIKPITDAFDAIPKAVRARFAEAVDGKALFPGHTDAFQAPRRRFELFMLALNAGNESNLQRLTDGRNITVGEVRAALDLLTKEELDAVQAIFDAAESLRPEAFALEERVGGLAPKAIEATPMTLKGGTLRGGYFPAVYERAASVVGARQEAGALAQLLDPSYSRPNTPHSHLKSRADRVEAVISLEPRTVGTHLAQVAHDIAFREAVMSIGSLVISPEIKKVLTERLGEAKEKQFLQWVKDVGSMRGTQPSSGKVLDFFRSKMPTALLGFSAPTALGDLANLAAAVTSTPLATKHLAAGLAEFAASPVESRRVALEKSGELRSMQDTIKRDFAKATKALVARGPLETGPLAWLKDNAFAFMEGINVATATPVWLGGYRQAIAEGKSEGEAVRFADDLLTRVFPSHSAVDQAAILRDKGWLGKSTVFYGYLSTAYNAFRGIARPLRSKAYAEGTPAFRAKAVAQVAGRGFAFAVAFSVLGELLMGRGPDDGDRDDDEPDDKALMWRNWFVRKLLIAGPSTVPFLSDVASAVETRWTGRPINTRASPVAGAVLEIGKATEKVLNGDATAADKVAAGLKAFGLTTGVPTKPITTTGRYLFDVAAGEREVDGWGQFMGGIIYGERENQPINVFTAPGSLAN